jgi:hypothetical protein
VHYIWEDLARVYINDAATELDYMQVSDFVVDTSTNTLIKCRYAVDDIIDNFLNIQEK